MSLEARLRRQIAETGPMTVAAYMTACLHDPTDGYYAARPRLGSEGDFVTAPMVSQMFGELIGLWIGEVWTEIGRPTRFRLVELGPGDGTLMADLLRALRRIPGACEAVELWLVEPSGPLRSAQAARLGDRAPSWADWLAEVPAGAPMLLVANEVLDCLSVHQLVHTETGWSERRVGLDADGRLEFGLAGVPSGIGLPAEAPPGAVLEISPAQEALGAEIGARIAADGGAALLIDYGRSEPGFGDTLQAVRSHKKVSPLDDPGCADLTAHVDFPAVATAARAEGVETTAIMTQSAWLEALGVRLRADALARARPDRAEAIGRQLARLIDPDQMGELFKVLAIHQPGLRPPGFPAAGPDRGFDR